MSDLGRQRLKEIRTLQGWREAYKVAGLTAEGSDATKRRRLSRLINQKTTGAKELSSAQKAKINRAYRYRKKSGRFIDARVEKEVKAINKTRAQARKNARAVFGARGSSPDRAKLERRLRKYRDLDEDEINRIRRAFESAEEDEGVQIRAEYASQLSKVPISKVDPKMRIDFERRLRKAKLAVERDKKKARSE